MVKRGNEAVMGPHHASSHTDAAADLAVEQKVMFVGDKPFFRYVDDWSRIIK